MIAWTWTAICISGHVSSVIRVPTSTLWHHGSAMTNVHYCETSRTGYGVCAIRIQAVLCRAKVAAIVGISKQCHEDVEGCVGSGSLVFYVSLVATELGHQVWS